MMFRKKTGKALVVGGTPRLNLLPPQEVEIRARRALWTRWMRAFVAAFLFVAIEGAIGASWTIRITDRRAAETATSEQLLSQLAKYSDVIELHSHVQKLENLRGQAGVNDQAWGALLARINTILPEGVELVGFSVAPGAAPIAGLDPVTQVGLSGTLTFAAKATSAQAETIMQLRKVETIIDVDAGQLSSDGPAGGFTFVTTFSADQTRYTGRFVHKGGE